MREPVQYQDDDLFNPETSHEHSDVPVRPLFWAVVIFIIVGVISHFAIWFLYKAFVNSERRRMDPPQTAVTRPAGAGVPQNQPLLQPFPRNDPKGVTVPPNRNTPVTDLEDMRRAEDEVLNNYGWVDKQKGVVRIPIERAKELAVQRLNAPVAAPAAAPPVTPPPTTTGGEQ